MINIFRLNLACLAVGSTVCGETLGKALNRLNLACLAVGSTANVAPDAFNPFPPQSSLFGCRFDFRSIRIPCKNGFPPQSSLFGCRFDQYLYSEIHFPLCRLNLACLAVGSTAFSRAPEPSAGPPQSSLFGCRFDRFRAGVGRG